MQRWALADGRGVWRADTTLAPLERWVGGLGMPGLTAYFGLFRIAGIAAGETVVVSAAAGGVGQVVGQLARLHGARVVGIAGGPEKCRFLTDELGFEAAIDYRSEDPGERLDALCPDGFEVYWESVGGPVGDACIRRLKTFGRAPVCGLIHYYNAPAGTEGLSPAALRAVLVNRLTLRGFIFFDFADAFDEAATALGEWHAGGHLRLREDVREGDLEDFPAVLNELYTGGNFGKLVLRLRD